MPNDISANTVSANQVSATSYGGLGGGGATIAVDKIILGGWTLEASGDDGIYVTTPGGVRTKMELIDFRQTPVPETAELKLAPPRPSVSQELPGGPAAAGGPTGNWSGGGGSEGSTPTSPGRPASTPPNQTIIPGGDGQGYAPISDQARSRLPANLNNEEFLGCLDGLAQRLNVPADSILAVMQIESRLNPQAVNASTGASGLNQIMPSTAQGLGYNIEQIRSMSGSQQMCGPTTAYFTRVRMPAAPTTADLYLANFYPAAVGQSDEYVLGNHPPLTPQRVAAQNPAFVNSQGVITVGSVRQYIANRSGS